MSVHDERNATMYKCKNCGECYTDRFTREEIQKHAKGECIKSAEIINIKSGKKYDIYCGRKNMTYNLPESLLFSPFIIGKNGTRDEVIKKYKDYFYERIAIDENFKEEVLKCRGKILACWCAPEKCHCEIIKEYLDNLKTIKTLGMESKNKKYRAAIVGSRNYNNKNEIYKYLDSKKDKIEHLVSGGCPSGADNIAQSFAKERGLSITIHYPDWNGLGKSAGFARNRKIVEDCEVLVAFTTGSKGTQNSIDLAKKLNKIVIIHHVNPDPPKERDNVLPYN